MGIFTVGDSGKFTFEYLFDGGWFQGELGVYNLAGMPSDPGSPEYIQEAARRALTKSNEGHLVMQDRLEGAKYNTPLPWEIDYNDGDHLGVKTFEMDAGEQFAFIFTQHTSLQELAEHPERATQWGKLPLFSIPEANPDYTGNAPEQFAALDNFGTFGFEAVRVDDNSDRDYNETVFQITGATTVDTPYYGTVRNPGKNFRISTVGQQIREASESNLVDDGYLTVGNTGEITIDFLFDGGWYSQGELGIFSLDGIDDQPGTLEFIQEAATRATSESPAGQVLIQDHSEGARLDYAVDWEPQFNDDPYQGEKTFQLTPGGRYGLIYVPNTTLEDIAETTSLDGSNGTFPFFSMKGANILNAVQFIDHAEGTEDYSILGIEDLNVLFEGELGGDRDYNDVILSIEGASFYAPGYANEKNPNLDTNFAVIANHDSDLTYKDTSISLKIADLLGNDYDYDGDTFSFTSFDTTGTSGLVTRVNDVLIYDPNGQFDSLSAGQSAIDSFTYTITDSNGETDTATVAIEVKGFDEDGSENNVGTLDTMHLLPPLYAKQDVRDHYLVLSTNEETPFTMTIQNADGANGVAGGINETVTISKDFPLVIDLTSAPFASGNGHASLGVIAESQVGLIDSVEGLILNADRPFYANVRHETKVQGLSLSSKGQLALGTEFRSGHLVTNTQQDWRKAHFISVMASEDNTTVSFQDLPEGVTFVNGYPGQITLDKYESFVVGLNIQDNHDNPNSLQGSLIVADKPVAVNSGSWLSGTVGSGRDIGVDQLIPTNLVGTKYILVKGEATTNAGLLERPIIIATEDNTEVYLRGESTIVATLNAGEELILDGDEYLNSDALLIETSKAAYVYQMTSANNSTAPGLNLALPVADNAGSQEIIIPSIDLLGPGKLNIVARTTATIEIDGSAISGGVAVEGDSNFLVYQIEDLSGDVIVTADESIIVTSTTGAGHIGAASYWSGLPTTFAFDDTVETTADTAIDIDVLGNDLTGSGFQPIGFPELPSNGTAVLNDDDTITYTPNAGFSGTDVFVYRGVNDSGKTDTAIVTVSVDQNPLEGTTGDDTLVGSVVSDRIIGYAGEDTITTGAGNDVLVFNAPGDGVDTITDFTVGNDVIDMTAILGTFNPIEGGLVSFTQDGNNAVMKYDGSDLAIFENSSATEMNDSDNFVF